MTNKIIVSAFALVAFLMCQVGSAQPAPPRADEVAIPTAEFQDAGKDKQPTDKKKTPDPKDKKLEPETDIFTRTPTMGPQFATGFNPYMLGDFGIFFAKQTFTLVGTQTSTQTSTIFVNQGGSTGVPKKIILATNTTTTTTPFTQTRTIVVPFASSAAAFKIAENESPRPVDRVFFTWNYFGAIRGPDNGGATNFTTNSQTLTNFSGLNNLVATSIVTSLPAPPRATANLHREMFGFEKTFLDGYASIELRAPMIQMTGNFQGIGAQNFGDLTVIGKYAFLLDNTTGDVVSGGLALTAPTGPGISTVDGSLHSTLIQPWFGYILNSDRFFLNAFHSVVAPTDRRDVTLLFNDVGLNFWLYRAGPDRTLNYIVPLVEAHLTTPLNHRSSDSLIYVPDTLVITSGVNIGLMRNANLSLGIATPVTGPRIFNIETFMSLNWRF
jgi:hypothetical protein